MVRSIQKTKMLNYWTNGKLRSGGVLGMAGLVWPIISILNECPAVSKNIKAAMSSVRRKVNSDSLCASTTDARRNYNSDS